MSIHVDIARFSNTTHLAAASALLAATLALTLCPSARAEDRGHDERGRGRMEHRQVERYDERRPYYGYYGGPPVVYAPAPVYYGEPPGTSFNLSFPFYR
jgi:hypothetical protein